MARVNCVMMQRDETLLLEPGLRYDGYLFGLRKLTVVGNGSAEVSRVDAVLDPDRSDCSRSTVQQTLDDVTEITPHLDVRAAPGQASRRRLVPFGDGETYAAKPDVTPHRLKMLKHYFRHGFAEGRPLRPENAARSETAL
ncbi:hypothetical protein NFI95_12205 [Acetobacteraceae bacterium KSS8]|uniref:Uncharacterized protein n=1 Tax=Endosaccharibacter trunci TaxID=2812733 RepID=A0ABT1W8K2_9PROT|nr:hypothetical protein [Acetobacteraceae bacterium KSS8]